MAVVMRTGIPESWWESFDPPPGMRAEIIRGELVLSPSPSRLHVRIQSRLLTYFASVLPDRLEALYGIEWRLLEGGLVVQAPQPDLVVVERSDDPIVTAPLLAIEVISPSDYQRFGAIDLTRLQGKRRDYAANGLQHYIEIDPEGAIARYELRGERLVEVDLVGSSEVLSHDEPFSYSLRLDDLLA